MAVTHGLTVANSALDTFCANYNSGTIKVYDATGGVPANATVALGSQVLLGTLTFGASAFGAAAAKSAAAVAITQDSAADATGTAAFYRALKIDGTTVIEQGTVGTSGADLNLNTTSIVVGGPIQVTGFTKTMP